MTAKHDGQNYGEWRLGITAKRDRPKICEFRRHGPVTTLSEER